MTESSVRQFTASDGYCFQYRQWGASSAPPRGYVVGLHGIQSHSGWYEYSSRRLGEAGYEVLFLDRRGSGENSEQRGHAPHADRLAGDVIQVLADLKHHRDRDNTGAPIVLMGVSWGGKLAAVVAARRPELVDALALLYPGICARVRPSWWQRMLLRLAVQTGDMQRTARIPLDDPALFTSDVKWQQFIRDDPLALHEATVGLLSASVQLDREASEAAESIDCPTLLMLAGRDAIIDNGATRDYFQRIAAKQKKLIEYPDAAHTLEFEPDRDRFVDDLIGWLDSLYNR